MMMMMAISSKYCRQTPKVKSTYPVFFLLLIDNFKETFILRVKYRGNVAPIPIPDHETVVT